MFDGGCFEVSFFFNSRLPTMGYPYQIPIVLYWETPHPCTPAKKAQDYLIVGE